MAGCNRAVMRCFLGLAFIVGITTADAGADGADGDISQLTTNLNIVNLSDAELKIRKITKFRLGDLQVPTGEIVASDFLVNPEFPAFARKVPVGAYPVVLYQSQSQYRNAIAELRIKPGVPIKWEMATIPGQEVSTLKKDEMFGYPVDAGTRSFYDKAAYKLMQKREQQEREQNPKYDNYFSDVLSNEYDQHVMHHPVPGNPVNVAVFSSGWGDGVYASYWGLDAEGEALVLITYFDVFHLADDRSYEELTSIKIGPLSPEQLADRASAQQAVDSDDAEALRKLLNSRKIEPESFIPGSLYGLIYSAVTDNKPKSLEALVAYGANTEVPADKRPYIKMGTYPELARYYARAQSEEKWTALLDVVDRWEKGLIPNLAPTIGEISGGSAAFP